MAARVILISPSVRLRSWQAAGRAGRRLLAWATRGRGRKRVKGEDSVAASREGARPTDVPFAVRGDRGFCDFLATIGDERQTHGDAVARSPVETSGRAEKAGPLRIELNGQG